MEIAALLCAPSVRGREQGLAPAASLEVAASKFKGDAAGSEARKGSCWYECSMVTIPGNLADAAGWRVGLNGPDNSDDMHLGPQCECLLSCVVACRRSDDNNVDGRNSSRPGSALYQTAASYAMVAAGRITDRLPEAVGRFIAEQQHES